MLKLREGGHADLTRFYTLFEVDFDSEELISKLSLHKGLMNGSVELLVMYDDESRLETAYALCFVKGMYDYVLLKYFGVLPWYREKGLGVEAMRLLNKRYAGRQGIIAEITEFADPDPEQKAFQVLRPLRLCRDRQGLPYQRHEGAPFRQAHQGNVGHRAHRPPHPQRPLLPLPYAPGEGTDDRYPSLREKSRITRDREGCCPPGRHCLPAGEGLAPPACFPPSGEVPSIARR